MRGSMQQQMPVWRLQQVLASRLASAAGELGVVPAVQGALGSPAATYSLYSTVVANGPLHVLLSTCAQHHHNIRYSEDTTKHTRHHVALPQMHALAEFLALIRMLSNQLPRCAMNSIAPYHSLLKAEHMLCDGVLMV